MNLVKSLSLIVIFIFLALTALHAQGAGPLLAVTPNPVNFGDLAFGTNSTIPVYLSKSDPWDPTVAQIISIDIGGSAAFSYDFSYTLPTSFSSAETKIINVNFIPTTPGMHYGNLYIVDNQMHTYDIPLSGNSLNAPDEPHLTIRQEPLYITQFEDRYESENVTFVNTGTMSLTYQIDSATLPSWMSFSTYSVTGKAGELRSVSGIVAAGDSTSFMINIDTRGLATGSYFHSVQVATNESGGFHFWPVYLTVNTAPLVADFSAYPRYAHIGTTINFTNTTRVDSTVTTLAGMTSEWDLNNDGVTDSWQTNPTFIYSTAGLYPISLTVHTIDSMSDSEYKHNYINIYNNPPVVHDSIATVTTNEDVIWGPASFFDFFTEPDGDIMTFAGVKSAHIFVDVTGSTFSIRSLPDWYGVETVRLIATDPYGESSSHSLEVTVNPVNDTPVLSVPSDIYFINDSHLTVNFADYVEDVDNPDSDISMTIMHIPSTVNDISVVYEPDMNGLLTAVFTNVVPDWFGSNAFSITVNDAYGRAIASQSFTMHSLEHFTAQFTTDPSLNLAGQIIPFTDTTLGNPDWWHWDFENDGTPDSMEQNPTHQYMNSGIYSVRLTLGNTEANEQATVLYNDLFHIIGTALVGDIPPNLGLDGSPYNVVDSLNIPAGGVTIAPNVVLNFLSENPLILDAPIFANGVFFQAPPGENFWGGLVFGEGSGGASLEGCHILNALNPLVLMGADPSLLDLEIAVTDTTSFIDQPGVYLNGSSANLNNIRILNYRRGIQLGNDNRTLRTTPTLTNIRIRNSSETSREVGDNYGVTITGDVDAELSDVEIVNCKVGISLINEDRTTTTPTLTNIRVRNSSETSRGITTGILVMGAVAPDINDAEFSGLSYGIDMQSTAPEVRTTPTLTNIRVRNSSETSRGLMTGIRIDGLPAVALENIETTDLTTGIEILNNGLRTTSTPTLTNIRVRNSSETSRTTDYGIVLSGDITARIDDAVLENCSIALQYDKSGTYDRTVSTPTLTNIRVRNSSETSRAETIGIRLIDLMRVTVDNDSLIGCTKALEIVNSSVRTVSTPTLTNIRVRNSSETSRFDNIGIHLHPGVNGKIGGCDIQGAKIGLKLEDGAHPEILPNFFKNCGTAIKAISSVPANPLQRQIVTLETPFMIAHSGWEFVGMEVEQAGPWMINNNTFWNYPILLRGISAAVTFTSNIGWANFPIPMPIIAIASPIEARFNDILYMSGILPGLGNISAQPLMANPMQDDFMLLVDSPCIDAGDPSLPRDPDESITDIGAKTYLHRAAMESDTQFVTTGSTVSFTNTSWGHEDARNTLVEWDLNNDGTIEATSWNWSRTFTQPGLYDLRLRMQTGTLIDEVIYHRAVVVQNLQLMPPVIYPPIRTGSDIVITWQPVSLTVQNEQVTVPYYLVYKSKTPEGEFRYLGFTEAPQTSYLHVMGASEPRAFYIVIGYAGTRSELDDYIRLHPTLSPDVSAPPLPEERLK